jgi:hypothetical protein
VGQHTLDGVHVDLLVQWVLGGVVTGNKRVSEGSEEWHGVGRKATFFHTAWLLMEFTKRGTARVQKWYEQKHTERHLPC